MHMIVTWLPRLAAFGAALYVIAPWSIWANTVTGAEQELANPSGWQQFAAMHGDTIGLEDLRNSGAIRFPSEKEVFAWNEGASVPYRTPLQPKFRFKMKFDYVVTRAIELPPGLNGAYSKQFLVLNGVPEPTGDPGHSCIATMDGFKFTAESHCFGDDNPAIRELAELKGRTYPAACQVLQTAERDHVMAIGVYQAAGRTGGGHVPGDIDVTVSKPGNTVLVLSSYEPVRWRIAMGARSRITGIVLAGMHTSTVAGVLPSVPLIVRDQRSEKRRPTPVPECSDLHTISESPDAEGPELLLLDHHVRGILGRGLDSFQGAYELQQAEIR
jgi:hypothetical protein